MKTLAATALLFGLLATCGAPADPESVRPSPTPQAPPPVHDGGHA